MPLYQHLTYEPCVKEIEKEEDVLRLIKDVRTEIGEAYFYFQKIPLRRVLEIIEKGFHDSERPAREGVSDKIDLSQARELIKEYRKKSEGCTSCENYRCATELGNEKTIYCKLFESFYSDFGMSPRITQYLETGCEDLGGDLAKRISGFRKLEKVLAEAE